VGVEPTGDRETCRPPVLKTGTITGPHALPDKPLFNCANNKERNTVRGFALVRIAFALSWLILLSR
jgi:hypothetical protein